MEPTKFILYEEGHIMQDLDPISLVYDRAKAYSWELRIWTYNFWFQSWLNMIRMNSFEICVDVYVYEERERTLLRGR